MRCLEITVVLCLILEVIFSSDAAAQPIPEMNGVFDFIGGEQQIEAHRNALESAVLGLNPLIRPIARKVLQKHLGIPQFVTFKAEAHHLVITMDPYPPRRSALDGTTTVFKTIRGARGTIRRTLRERAITERIESEGNRKVITYQFHEDNERMSLRWHTSIPRYFRHTIGFSLSYRRQLEGS